MYKKNYNNASGNGGVTKSMMMCHVSGYFWPPLYIETHNKGGLRLCSATSRMSSDVAVLVSGLEPGPAGPSQDGPGRAFENGLQGPRARAHRISGLGTEAQARSGFTNFVFNWH